MVGRDEFSALFREEFDIVATSSFILRNGFQRVALQFPDELLKHSVAVSSALKKEISKQRANKQGDQDNASPRFYVMADTTFGSCCADEVAAMHVDAQCIVHYGHTCLSRTSRLPVWFVFGRGTIDAESCASRIVEFAAGKNQAILVLFGLNYIHAIHSIQEKVSVIRDKDMDISFANSPSQLMKPAVKGDKSAEGRKLVKPAASKPVEQDRISEPGVDSCCQSENVDGCHGQCNDTTTETCCSTNKGATTRDVLAVGASRDTGVCSEYNVGGFKWIVPTDRGMEDYIILWIGGDDPGLTNISLIFNSSTIVRYDGLEDKIMMDVLNQSRLLQRRYYLVERAKDASVVGIVVGTLGVAGYGEALQRIRRMVEAAGKKAYTVVMGKPNPAKLANFPECEVFVLVACPQTALLDSKDYLAPVITPFEAELAFLEGKQWTGAFQLDFATDPVSDSIAEGLQESSDAEPRFSFFTGSYVGKDHCQEQGVQDESSRSVVLSRTSQHALQLQSESSMSIITTERSVLDIKSGAEYLASRTYQGLNVNQEGPEGPRKASLAVVGRKGRAAVYRDEPTNE